MDTNARIALMRIAADICIANKGQVPGKVAENSKAKDACGLVLDAYNALLAGLQEEESP